MVEVMTLVLAGNTVLVLDRVVVIVLVVWMLVTVVTSGTDITVVVKLGVQVAPGTLINC